MRSNRYGYGSMQHDPMQFDHEVDQLGIAGGAIPDDKIKELVGDVPLVFHVDPTTFDLTKYVSPDESSLQDAVDAAIALLSKMTPSTTAGQPYAEVKGNTTDTTGDTSPRNWSNPGGLSVGVLLGGLATVFGGKTAMSVLGGVVSTSGGEEGGYLLNDASPRITWNTARLRMAFYLSKKSGVGDLIMKAYDPANEATNYAQVAVSFNPDMSIDKLTTSGGNLDSIQATSIPLDPERKTYLVVVDYQCALTADPAWANTVIKMLPWGNDTGENSIVVGGVVLCNQDKLFQGGIMG